MSVARLAAVRADSSEWAEPTDVTADEKGRVRLASIGVAPGRRFRAEPLGDGSDRIVLTPLPSERLGR